MKGINNPKWTRFIQVYMRAAQCKSRAIQNRVAFESSIIVITKSAVR